MQDLTPEEKLVMGRDELQTLKQIFERWMKSDISWAIDYIRSYGSTHEEDEWDFLREDWLEKFSQWIRPYLNRLEETQYITRDDWVEYCDWAYVTIEIMMQVLYKLGEETDGE